MKPKKPSATALKMAAFLKEHEGKNQTEQAKILGVHISTIAYWRRQVKTILPSSQTSFVEIAMPRKKKATAALSVRVGNVLVEVPSDFDGSHLRRVIKELAQC